MANNYKRSRSERMGRMRAQRKRTTRRNAKSRIVGEYTLSRILVPFRVSRKLAARFIIAEEIVEVEHIKTTMQDNFPGDHQAYVSAAIFRKTYVYERFFNRAKELKCVFLF